MIFQRLLFFLTLMIVSVQFMYGDIVVSQGNSIELGDDDVSALGSVGSVSIGFDHVFVFSNLTDAEISYAGTETNVNWYRTTDLNASISNQTYMSPDDATGYVLRAGTDSVTFYVIDYSQLLPTLNSLVIDDTFDNPCENVLLELDASIPAMQYSSYKTGQTIRVNRTFELNYTTKEWNADELLWDDKEVDSVITIAAVQWYAPSPLCNTTFALSGDQIAVRLGLPKQEVETATFQAVRVKCHPTTITEIRDALNEADRPVETSIEGSAPLNILFKSNANEPVAMHYEWRVEKNEQMLMQRNDREFRHTFDEAGEYQVRLEVTNDAGCVDSTSVTVKVSDSSLEVPNVFTPNGDGKNDEFRVAYKSIVEFEGYVYNRWGRRVFHWDDPAIGWDGTINGKPASTGTYFYNIKAKGSDGKEYKLKGDINLIGR